MPEKLLREKIGWKPGNTALLLDLPEGMDDPFAGVAHVAATAKSAKPGKQPLDVALAFTRDQAALASAASVLLPAVTESTRLWLAYPKKSGAIPTDLTRDAGWHPMFDAGWIVVAIVSIDSTWSAVRFRPKALVKSVRYPANP